MIDIGSSFLEEVRLEWGIFRGILVGSGAAAPYRFAIIF